MVVNIHCEVDRLRSPWGGCEEQHLQVCLQGHFQRQLSHKGNDTVNRSIPWWIIVGQFYWRLSKRWGLDEGRRWRAMPWPSPDLPPAFPMPSSASRYHGINSSAPLWWSPTTVTQRQSFPPIRWAATATVRLIHNWGRMYTLGMCLVSTEEIQNCRTVCQPW